MADNEILDAADRPSADRQLGLGSERIGDRQIIKYDAGLALRICELVAGGMTLAEICQLEGFPTRSTFYRWTIRQPELAKALAAARELSAYNFEEEALGLAREIKMYPENGTKVRAYEVAMGQLRWSAARRNPREYSEKGNLNIVVPVNINTTLDMGTGPAVGSAALPDVYSLEASMEVPPLDEPPPIDAEFTELPPKLEPGEPLLKTTPKKKTVYPRKRKKP